MLRKRKHPGSDLETANEQRGRPCPVAPVAPIDHHQIDTCQAPPTDAVGTAAAAAAAAVDKCQLPRPFRTLKRNEIRVLQLKPGRGHDRVCCALEHVELDDRLVFEALSYTWACEDDVKDRSLSETIFLEGLEGRRNDDDDDDDDATGNGNGSGNGNDNGNGGGGQFRVTRNCLAALRSIRRASGPPRVVWVDAICIFQGHEGEKYHQLRLMAEIYRRASRVLVYVGQKVPSPQRLLQIMRQQTTQFQGRRAADDAKLVRAFFRKPYFCRLWVIQEIILARSVELFFAGASVVFSPSGNRWLRQIVRFRAAPSWLKMSLGNHKTGNRTLFDILMDTHSAKCLDARDRVISVLGIFGQDILGHSSESDGGGGGLGTYALSTADIFTAAATYILKKENNWKMLRQAVGPDPRLGLPSWVPDWTNSDPATPWSSYHPEAPRDRGPSYSRLSWHCGSSTQKDLRVPSFSIDEKAHTLTLRGHVAWSVHRARLEELAKNWSAWWTLEVPSTGGPSHVVTFKTPSSYKPGPDDYLFIAEGTNTPYIIRKRRRQRDPWNAYDDDDDDDDDDHNTAEYSFVLEPAVFMDLSLAPQKTTTSRFWRMVNTLIEAYRYVDLVESMCEAARASAAAAAALQLQTPPNSQGSQKQQRHQHLHDDDPLSAAGRRKQDDTDRFTARALDAIRSICKGNIQKVSSGYRRLLQDVLLPTAPVINRDNPQGFPGHWMMAAHTASQADGNNNNNNASSSTVLTGRARCSFGSQGAPPFELKAAAQGLVWIEAEDEDLEEGEWSWRDNASDDGTAVEFKENFIDHLGVMDEGSTFDEDVLGLWRCLESDRVVRELARSAVEKEVVLV